MSAFESLAFCPDAVMETFAQKVIGNPDALTLKDSLCVLKVYSSLNYDLKHQRQPYALLTVIYPSACLSVDINTRYYGIIISRYGKW